jgi:glycerol-3-phosphate acyltransferase PlsY
VAKAKGIDIRSVGSGNIGATNAMRVLGKPAGIFVLLLDALKGYAAVFVCGMIYSFFSKFSVFPNVHADCRKNRLPVSSPAFSPCSATITPAG